MGESMAIIYEGKNINKELDVIQKTKSGTRGLRLTIILSSILLCVALMSFVSNTYKIILIYIIFFLILLWLFTFAGVTKTPKLNYVERIGEHGEQKALTILSQLDDSFTIFHNVDISYNSKSSQLDVILVSKHGVFVIEVKNMNGHIYGNYNDYELIQEKIGRRGGRYQSVFYNPIKQVGTHVYRLSNFMKSYGIDQYITGIVFFVNEDVSLDIDTDDILVFDAKDVSKLFSYIHSQNLRMTHDRQNKIVKLLLQSIENTEKS